MYFLVKWGELIRTRYPRCGVDTECNSSTFLFAAMDTTSNALSIIIHLLANHQDVQDKLRAEIKATNDTIQGDIPYDQLVELPYLDAICRETMRL